MIWGILETVMIFGAVVWIPFEVDRYFVNNLIPLPSWPYGVSLAIFTFFFMKTLFVFFRSLVSSAQAASRPGKPS